MPILRHFIPWADVTGFETFAETLVEVARVVAWVPERFQRIRLTRPEELWLSEISGSPL